MPSHPVLARSTAVNGAITPKSTPKERRPNPLVAMPIQGAILHALSDMTPVFHPIVSLSVPIPGEIQLAIATDVVGVEVRGPRCAVPGTVEDVGVVFGVHEFGAIKLGVVLDAGYDEGANDAGLEGEGAHADGGV